MLVSYRLIKDKKKMASSQIRKFLIGQVVAKGTEKTASVQVKCPKTVLDKFLLMVRLRVSLILLQVLLSISIYIFITLSKYGK